MPCVSVYKLLAFPMKECLVFPCLFCFFFVSKATSPVAYVIVIVTHTINIESKANASEGFSSWFLFFLFFFTANIDLAIKKVGRTGKPGG